MPERSRRASGSRSSARSCGDHDGVEGYTAAEPGWMERIWADGIAALSSTGVLGDPSGATAAGGSGDLRRARRRARRLDRPGVRYPPRALSAPDLPGCCRYVPQWRRRSPSSTQGAGGAVRTGVIGTMVAALAFFDGVVLGAPVALLAASFSTVDRLRGRDDRGDPPRHRLLFLGRAPMGGLVLGKRQPHRQATRSHASEPVDGASGGLDRARLGPLVRACCCSCQPDPRPRHCAVDQWPAGRRAPHSPRIRRLCHPVRRDVDVRRLGAWRNDPQRLELAAADGLTPGAASPNVAAWPRPSSASRERWAQEARTSADSSPTGSVSTTSTRTSSPGRPSEEKSPPRT